jgi:NADH-quinone oxidoreductase subunit L
MARPIVPARLAPAEAGFWKVLFHKYYVDEFYEAAIVGPLRRFSEKVLWKDVDQGIIDRGGVEGSARLARTLGWIGSRLQTGQVGLYLTMFLAGALGIFFVVMG